MKPSSLMRKSPSLESVIKIPANLSRPSCYSYNKANSKLRYRSSREIQLAQTQGNTAGRYS